MNSLGFSVKVEVIARLRKTSKKHWLHNVLERPEKLLKIPYETCCLWRLLRLFSQDGSKTYQKSSRFSVKVEVILQLRKTSKKHWLHSVLEHPEKLPKIPYKTCRLWRLLTTLSQNGSKKYQKRIRFSSKS